MYRDSCSMHDSVTVQTLKKAATRKETTFNELDAQTSQNLGLSQSCPWVHFV